MATSYNHTLTTCRNRKISQEHWPQTTKPKNCEYSSLPFSKSPVLWNRNPRPSQICRKILPATPSYSLAATQAPSDHTIHQFQDKLSHRSSVVKFQLEVGLHRSPDRFGFDGIWRWLDVFTCTETCILTNWVMTLDTYLYKLYMVKNYVRPPILSDCSNVQKVSHW